MVFKYYLLTKSIISLFLNIPLSFKAMFIKAAVDTAHKSCL